MASSELVLFDKSIDPETPVSVTVAELQDLFENGVNWGEQTNRMKTMKPWKDYATVHERVCRDFGGEEGTVGEGYDFACSSCGFMSAQTGARFCPNCGARVVS